ARRSGGRLRRLGGRSSRRRTRRGAGARTALHSFRLAGADPVSAARRGRVRMSWKRVVALSGGVGGARFVDGLARALPHGALTVIVNAGDDFVHLGLYVCPDLDTVMYTLAGLGDEERGWGLADESFSAMRMVARYGGPDWFSLGDRDLATHLLRTEALAAGESLSKVTERLCAALGVDERVLPMADGPCRTLVETADQGTLPFQQWFVGRRAIPVVRAVRFEGRPPPA